MKRYTHQSTNLFVVLTLINFLSTPIYAKKIVDQTLAAVNDEVILSSDLDKFIKRAKSPGYQELFGNIDMKAIETRKGALQLLIEEKIINQQVKKLELQASDLEVDGQIRAILSRNHITQAQLTARLKQLGTTWAEYREGIRRQIERKNLIDREIKPLLQVSEEQLRHYYNRNSGENDEQEYEIAHILITPGGSKGTKAETRAQTVWKEVSDNPEKFDQLAKEYSDDSETSASGGKLGSFAPSSLAKEFRKIVPETSVGSVTKPIKTAAGYHIVKVLANRKRDFKDLPKDKKEMVRSMMIQEELEKKMNGWLERKKRDSYVTVHEEKINK